MFARVRAAALLLGLVFVPAASSLRASESDRALVETEGQRKAAENGVRKLKAQVAAQADALQRAYSEAASKQNAWLDATCQAIERGAETTPDVTSMADEAATAYNAWVALQNPALGLTTLDANSLAGVKKWMVTNLVAVTSSAWKRSHKRAEADRAKASAELKERLRWKAWDDIP
jgi:hypothetical protein